MTTDGARPVEDRNVASYLPEYDDPRKGHATATIVDHEVIGAPEPQGASREIELSIDVDLETIRYPHAGIAWEATPWLDLGVSYRGGFKLVVEPQR